MNDNKSINELNILLNKLKKAMLDYGDTHTTDHWGTLCDSYNEIVTKWKGISENCKCKVKILPCPFCGLDITHIGTGGIGHEGMKKIECMGCLAQIYGRDEQEVIMLWNSRSH